jgi:hypothetical protein
MKMKTVLFLLVSAFTFAATPSFAITTATTGETSTSHWSEAYSTNPNMKELTPEMLKMSMNAFLALTPSKYKEMTGQKLGLKKSLALKAAQKVLKAKGGSDKLSKGLYILLAILGWGFVGIGLATDWDGNEWIICLVLSLLCVLPGLIYALIKMKNYY